MSFLDTLAPQTNRIHLKSHFWLVYKASKMGETQNEKGLYKDLVEKPNKTLGGGKTAVFSPANVLLNLKLSSTIWKF